MEPDPVLEIVAPVRSLTVEKTTFVRRVGIWKEGERVPAGQYTWDDEGRLVSREDENARVLLTYDDSGLLAAEYTLDAEGRVISRILWERDNRARPRRRIRRSSDNPEDEIWTYEHDEAGRLTSEKRNDEIVVEKRDRRGLPVQEYSYHGDRPDLVTERRFDDHGRLSAIEIRDPDGTLHRRTLYRRDSAGRLEELSVTDGSGGEISTEFYTYGATHGAHWLERVTWIRAPGGRGKRGRRIPRETVYRSFSYRDDGISSRVPAVRGFLAFPNGVYEGDIADGRPEGYGVFQNNDESRYEGRFHNGTMEGLGALSWPDGRQMEGEFRRGRLEGEGRCTWSDGSTYKGAFSEGRMHGPGTFTWADGTVFNGLFHRGKRTDQGTYERPDNLR